MFVVVIVVGGTKFWVKGLVVLLLTVLHCSAALIGKSLNKVSLCTPASPLDEKWVTETGRSMVREESSSRLVGDVTSLSTSIKLVVVGSSAGWAIEPRFKVSLSPPTDTKVALDLSPTSFGGESPVAMFGFFLYTLERSFVALSSLFFMSTLFSSSAFAFKRLFL